MSARKGGPRPRPVSDRIMASVQIDPMAGCWNWLLRLDVGGYGRIGIGGKIYLAHRVSYETFVGPIGDGLQVDHLCRNRACVNPQHLEPVTPLENVRRGHHPNVLATQCQRGHAYDGDNTTRHKGRRYCRTCMRAYMRALRALSPDERQARRDAGLPLVDIDALWAQGVTS